EAAAIEAAVDAALQARAFTADLAAPGSARSTTQAAQAVIERLARAAARTDHDTKHHTRGERAMTLPRSTDQFPPRVQRRDPHQPEFLQAVREVTASLWPFLERHPEYAREGLIERLVEPERVVQFRVAWVNDHNQVQVNRAWRVQHSSAIGPFKG